MLSLNSMSSSAYQSFQYVEVFLAHNEVLLKSLWFIIIISLELDAELDAKPHSA